jgi:uncharacterized protein (TIGR03084 family)
MDHAQSIDALVAEQDRLESILRTLDAEAWASPSGASGWTVSDVVLHLAQTEEAVAHTIGAGATVEEWEARPADVRPQTTDDVAEDAVRAERADGFAVFERWCVARRASVAALRSADPDGKYRWADAPLKPATLGTTRLAEHWTHGLDVTEPLGIPFPDTDRLRHIAWLGHRSLPYAFALERRDPPALHCLLTAPSGDVWELGPPDAPNSVRGPAGTFCRVGARRLAAEDAGLVVDGPDAMAALRLLRNYAG